jgi:DNA polymerase/3'-5' exonuclease PolX
MSKMKLAGALEITKAVMLQLQPYCDRLEVGGSIRRKRPFVKDIELVCIPKQTPVDFFEAEFVVDPCFCAVVNQWPAVKGRPTGRYTQRILPQGITLDLFIANPRNWGMILAIRTGSAEFSYRTLACRWKRLGYKSEDGILRNKFGDQVEIREERDLFNLLGIGWVDPECREIAGT